MPDSRIYFGDEIKTLDESGKIGGYLIRFTDAEHRDLDGEYFTEKTYLGSKDGDGVDTYFHHGLSLVLPKEIDSEIKAEIEALREYTFAPVKTTRDAIGIFAEVVMDMAKQYESAVFGLAKQGKLGWSSGAVDHLVRVTPTGEIKRWPIGEASFTPRPAEPQNKAIPVKSLSGMKFVGLFSSCKSMLAEEMAQTTPSTWEVQSAFSRVIRKIAEGAKNASVTGVEFDWKNKAMLACSELGSEMSPLVISQVQEFLDSSDDEFYLKGIAESESFEFFDQAVAAATKLTQKMQHNHENRVKEGRVLSTSNRQTIQACRDALTALMSELDSLMAMSEPKPKGKEVDVIALRTQSMRIRSQAIRTLAHI